MPAIINSDGKRVLHTDGRQILRAAGAGCGCCAEANCDCEEITVTFTEITACGCFYDPQYATPWIRCIFAVDPNGTYTLTKPDPDECYWEAEMSGAFTINYYSSEANCIANNPSATNDCTLWKVSWGIDAGEGDNVIRLRMLGKYDIGGGRLVLFRNTAPEKPCPNSGDISNATECDGGQYVASGGTAAWST